MWSTHCNGVPIAKWANKRLDLHNFHIKEECRCTSSNQRCNWAYSGNEEKCHVSEHDILSNWPMENSINYNRIPVIGNENSWVCVLEIHMLNPLTFLPNFKQRLKHWLMKMNGLNRTHHVVYQGNIMLLGPVKKNQHQKRFLVIMQLKFLFMVEMFNTF